MTLYLAYICHWFRDPSHLELIQTQSVGDGEKVGAQPEEACLGAGGWGGVSHVGDHIIHCPNQGSERERVNCWQSCWVAGHELGPSWANGNVWSPDDNSLQICEGLLCERKLRPQPRERRSYKTGIFFLMRSHRLIVLEEGTGLPGKVVCFPSLQMPRIRVAALSQSR